MNKVSRSKQKGQPQELYYGESDLAPDRVGRLPAVRLEQGGREVAVVTLSGYIDGVERSPEQWARLFAAAPELEDALNEGVQDKFDEHKRMGTNPDEDALLQKMLAPFIKIKCPTH